MANVNQRAAIMLGLMMIDWTQPGGRGAGTSKCRFLHASGKVLTFVRMIDMIDMGLS